MIIECGADHVPGLHDVAGVQAGNGRFAGPGTFVPGPLTHSCGSGSEQRACSSVEVPRQEQHQKNDHDEADQPAPVVRCSPPGAAPVVNASPAEQQHKQHDDEY
jgi:hypothetical protein